MSLDDLVDVFLVNIGIPDCIGIDHCHRAKLAAIQATGGIDPHPARTIQAQRLDPLLGVGTQGRCGALLTALAVFLRVPQIGAEKDVALVEAH